jgi:hypothetical protein
LIGAIAGALCLSVAAVAWALTNNTADYSAVITQKVKAKPAGVNIAYNGTLNVGTSDNTQPNTAATTDVYFARQIKRNGSKFKACRQSDIDGKLASQVPKKCAAAVVGGGSATANVGRPGEPLGPRQDLKVVAYNGQKGRTKGNQILLAVSGGALGQTQRVIPGDIRSASAPFAFLVRFAVPANLQGIQASQIALTQFKVNIGTRKTVRKSKRSRQRISFLQLRGCPASGNLPVRAIVHFNNDDNTPGGQDVTDDSTSACR